MSLEELSNNYMILRDRTTPDEIRGLLAIADRDIEQARIEGLSPDWRLAMAHNAVLQCATAALRATGYRSRQRDKHKIVLSSLEHTIGADPDLVDKLNAFRRKRNLVTYDEAFAISEMEADELLSIAIDLRSELDTWLRKSYPELVN